MASSDPSGKPDSSSDISLGTVVVLLIMTFTGVGLFWAVVGTGRLETIVTWFWMGIGISVTYLLTHIALGVHQIKHDI